jgi:hypothetical protein
MSRQLRWVLAMGAGVAGILGGLLELYGTAVLNHPTYPLAHVCSALLAAGGAGLAIAAFIPRLSRTLLTLTAIGFTGLNTSIVLWPAEIFQLPFTSLDLPHVLLVYLLCLLLTSIPWSTAATMLWSLSRAPGDATQ